MTKWITFGDDTIPQIFAKSHKSFELLQDKPEIIKIAVSLGRMKQNPIAEVLNLWDR